MLLLMLLLMLLPVLLPDATNDDPTHDDVFQDALAQNQETFEAGMIRTFIARASRPPYFEAMPLTSAAADAP